MNDTNQNSTQEEEIDLRKLFEAIGLFFIKIWYWLMSILVSLRSLTKQNKYLLLAAVIGGLIWAIWNTSSVTPYYQGSIIAKSGYLNVQIAQNIVDNLNNMDSVELSNALNLPVSTVSNIKNFVLVDLLDFSDMLKKWYP